MFLLETIACILYYYECIKPVNDEQKAASKETQSPIDISEPSDDFIPIQKNQLN